MTLKLSTRLAAIVVLAAALSNTASAQSAWVSDVFEITLRTGPSTNNAIQLMIDSGTRLEVLETDDEAGYTRVRTGAGTEGWVLSRYLMTEPSAREQLDLLTSQLNSATEVGSSMEAQLDGVRAEFAEATLKISSLERDKSDLEKELEEIKQTAANTLAIDSQNQSLQQQLTDADIQISLLEQENESLSSQTTRNWFITGSLVLVGGILLGLILPRMKFQKRSRYDSF